MKLFSDRLLLVLLMAFAGAFTLACTPAESHNQSKNKYKFISPDEKPQGKARRLSNLKTHMVENSSSVEFVAEVQPLSALPSCTAEWTLPPGAKIIEGEKLTQVSIQAGEKRSFTISIDKKSLKKGDKIVFQSYQVKDGEKHGSPAVFFYGQQVNKKIRQKSLPKSSKKIYQ